MRLYHDLDYGYFTSVRGGSSPLKRINLKVGDASTLEVEFFRSGSPFVPASLDEMIFVIKDSYADDAEPLAVVMTEDWDADSDSDEAAETYRAPLNTNTEELRAVLGSGASVTLKAELTVTVDGEGPNSTSTVPCVVSNDLWKGDELDPTFLPTPDDDWVAHGHAQTLSGGQKIQARTNIGAAAADDLPALEFAGNPNEQAASNSLDLYLVHTSGNFTSGDTITIGDDTLTFSEVYAVPGDVVLGDDFNESLTALQAALTVIGYSSSFGGMDDLLVTDVMPGVAGNGVDTSASLAAGGAWANAEMSGGYATLDGGFLGRMCYDTTTTPMTLYHWMGTEWALAVDGDQFAPAYPRSVIVTLGDLDNSSVIAFLDGLDNFGYPKYQSYQQTPLYLCNISVARYTSDGIVWNWRVSGGYTDAGLDFTAMDQLSDNDALSPDLADWLSVIRVAQAETVTTEAVKAAGALMVADAGGAAMLDVGTTAGTVAAGDHTHAPVAVTNSEVNTAIEADPESTRTALAFTPLELSPVAWWDASDTSRVINTIAGGLAATAGQTVERWTDKIGGLHLEQSTSGQRRTLSTDGALIPNDTGGCSMTGSIPIDHRSMSIVIIHGKRTTTKQQPSYLWLNASFASGFQVNRMGGEIYGPTSTGAIAGYDVDNSLVALCYGASNSVIYNDCKSATLAVRNAGTQTITRLFDYDANASPYRMPIKHVMVFDRQLTLAEINLLRTWSATPVKEVVVSTLGDSIINGASANTMAQTFVKQLAQAKGWTIANGAIDGTQASYITGTATSVLNAAYVSGKVNRMIIHVGCNDLAAKVATATFLTSLGTIYTNLKAFAADWDVAVCTVPPRNASFTNTQDSAGYIADRATVNDALQAAAPGVYFDRLIDFDADAILGLDATADSTTWFNADKIHPNQNGHNRMAVIAGNAYP